MGPFPNPRYTYNQKKAGNRENIAATGKKLLIKPACLNP